jgi:hypothetical protein
MVEVLENFSISQTNEKHSAVVVAAALEPSIDVVKSMLQTAESVTDSSSESANQSDEAAGLLSTANIKPLKSRKNSSDSRSFFLPIDLI